MGKRKSSLAKRVRAKSKKSEPKLETEFTCPFCKGHNSVQCFIPRIKAMEGFSIGVAKCWICEANYHTRASNLTQPIDVYNEWLDECERVNNSDQEPVRARREWIPPGFDWLYDEDEDEDEDEDDDDTPLGKKPRSSLIN